MLLEAVQNALHLLDILETKCSALILKGTACTHFTQYNYGPFLFLHHLSLPLSFLKFIYHIHKPPSPFLNRAPSDITRMQLRRTTPAPTYLSLSLSHG